MFCEECGAATAAGAGYCASCGHALQGERTPPAPSRVSVTAPVSWPGADYGLPATGVGSLASPGQRLGARIVDGFVLLVGAFALLVGGRLLLLGPAYWIGLAAAVVFVLLYEVVLIALRGQTLGKLAFGIAVMRRDGRPRPGAGTAVARSATAGLLGIVPLGSILDSAWLLWDPNRQALHDKGADTLVRRVR